MSHAVNQKKTWAQARSSFQAQLAADIIEVFFTSCISLGLWLP